MAKNLIHIFGASGSGTTTLAEKISRELGYFHLDTDDYFWLPTDPVLLLDGGIPWKTIIKKFSGQFRGQKGSAAYDRSVSSWPGANP